MNSCLYVLDDISTLLHAMCVCSFIYGRGRGLPVLELKGLLVTLVHLVTGYPVENRELYPYHHIRDPNYQICT
jgi:hypothetical protein